MTGHALRAAQPLSLLLLPALLPQMVWVKRRTPRLAEAEGTSGRVEGTEPRLRLLAVGDSMAAGVGVAHHSAGLAGQLAERLAAKTARAVAWRVIARSGATARSTTRKLAKGPIGFAGSPDEPPDLVIVVVGINDLLRFRGLTDWRCDIGDLVDTIRGRLGPDVPIGFSGMPPVRRFPALPQPLRAVLGLRARLMDGVLRECAEGRGAFCVALPIEAMADQPHVFFARDRFHPSERGYAEVAAAFLPHVIDALHDS
ncbi:SGNH/GDSL hydrolase family protein [Streptomyces sp. 6N223]|uniref:SGNH/GDSL hydrolase family protein n=1 Tax=Streptomyces sp. 6N223 TaxID=3457412 RepID=UPI003FD4B65B